MIGSQWAYFKDGKMDIFTSFDKRLPSIKPNAHLRKALKGKNPKKDNQLKRPQKMELSPQRIRELVAKNRKKPVSLETTQESKIAGFLKAENGPENELANKGDIGRNKPDSEVTQGKLKMALGNGSFKFSDKERAVLEQILN